MRIAFENWNFVQKCRHTFDYSNSRVDLTLVMNDLVMINRPKHRNPQSTVTILNIKQAN